MNGVIIDDELYHVLAWIEMAKKQGVVLSKKYIWEHFLGRPSKKNMLRIFKEPLSEKQLAVLVDEKERIYRKLYRHKIKPVKGLIKFLKELRANNIKIAIATSAVPSNVSFTLRATGVKKYFKTIVDVSHVKLGKPHPEVYLQVASKLKVAPKDCVVFEDSNLGIQSGKRAGMKVVGVATTLKAAQLKGVKAVIKDFNNLSISKLQKIIS